VLDKAAADAQLVRIAQDADAFLAGLDDPEARGGPIPQPDGSFTERLPGFHRWIWDDGFCGSIGFRWRRGTEDLPPTCLGHVGYAVVPWKQGRGHATAALALILPQARAVGLRWIDLTTDPANLASQRVILANGGALLERAAGAVRQAGCLRRRGGPALPHPAVDRATPSPRTACRSRR